MPFQPTLTLPGHILSAVPGEREIKTSEDLRFFLRGSTKMVDTSDLSLYKIDQVGTKYDCSSPNHSCEVLIDFSTQLPFIGGLVNSNSIKRYCFILYRYIPVINYKF